jgi:hypothetical protein
MSNDADSGCRHSRTSNTTAQTMTHVVVKAAMNPPLALVAAVRL